MLSGDARNGKVGNVSWNILKATVEKDCGLTIRSTGPIAAGRHLGYKSLAQMPARHNGPVSSNVRRHGAQSVFLHE